MVDLWPETIQRPDMTMPLAILKEQAALLGKKTKNVVEAEVDRVTGGPVGYDFGYGFSIVAPLLGGYRYRLFTILHKVEPFPLDVYLDDAVARELAKNGKLTSASGPIMLPSEIEFVELLRLIFNSEKTKRVIQSIMAQSEVEASPQQG